MGRTLLDKIWDAHTVRTEDGGRSVLYIDRQYIHEVTSPVAFAGLERRGIGVARPAQITATADHNIPTVDQHLPIAETESRRQVEALEANCAKFGIEHFGVGNPRQGIVHIIGPELGFTQPGMTIVCGDSHTSTHGALGAVAFGVGTSEVEMVFASQCIIQSKPRSMRITVDGTLRPGVEAKDVVLYIISQLTASGGFGLFHRVRRRSDPFALDGRAHDRLQHEHRVRGAGRHDRTRPDDVRLPARARTCAAGSGVRPGRRPLGNALQRCRRRIRQEYRFDAADIAPMITYGTNPGMGMAVDAQIPAEADPKALEYMGFKAGEKLLGKPVDYASWAAAPTAASKTCGASPSWSKAGARPRA